MGGITANLFQDPRDPQFNVTTLLLSGDGTNGAQNNTFTDSSSNNFTITRTGNVSSGVFSPLINLGYSGHFPGTVTPTTTAGQYISGTTNLWSTNTSTFTVDGWIYPTSYSTTFGLILGDNAPNTTTLYEAVYLTAAGKIEFAWNDGTSKAATGSTTVPLNAWSYFAVRVSSNNIEIYVNSSTPDTLTGTTVLTDRSATNNFCVGVYGGNVQYSYRGYINNLRFSTIARTISVPTGNFVSDSDTKLLLFQQSSLFVDNSSSPLTLNVIPANGPGVQVFSPFPQSGSYTASYAASGFFPQGVDYLTATLTNKAPGTGSFTYECWLYCTNLSGCGVFNTRSGNTTDGFDFQVTSDGRIRFTYTDTIIFNSAANRVRRNSWFHIAIVRNGTTDWTVYLNGSSIGTLSNSSNFTSTNLNVGVTALVTPQYMSGYIVDFRYTQSAVYTSNFSVPTQPLTALPNTAILINFRNAGIVDSAIRSTPQVIGNAQISTDQKKFGNGSISFDGTGDYLIIVDSVDLRFGINPFTIEMWIYRNASAVYGLVAKGAATTGWLVSLNASNQVVFTFGTTTITSTGTVSQSTWTHIAVVREGTGTNQTKIYINGTNDGTGTVSTDFNQTTPLYIGVNRSIASAFNGYIDDLRITRTARYLANFDVPTKAFQTK